MRCPGFNPLAGIRCFLTNSLHREDLRRAQSFQSPCGDSLFSDVSHLAKQCQLQMRFNPLAGIRCFLTETGEKNENKFVSTFQSPCGDSLFSDANPQSGCVVTASAGFNPLAGIRCFLTDVQGGFLAMPEVMSFQSPCGDSLFSDPQILWVTDGR